ncbi:MAG: carbohydrate ABC transporter permease [Verrucomicrobia bacterium]|nr:carbohydrate ABC transporter permease [Verrucomicrobiota bacterium]MCH8513514.1 carbohydrate ABC transporter permease [Kiritimatiellia bacterium]
MPKKINKATETLKIGYVLFVLFFAFIPLFIMIVVSFKTNTQYQTNPFFFDHPSTWQWGNWSKAWDIVSGYIWNSIFVSVLSTLTTISMVLLSAYALARYRFPGRNIIYYGIIASMFLPGTAATLVTVFDLLRRLNLINSLWALVLMGTNGGQIAGVFLIKQFIEDIPGSLFEAAQMDGAGHLHQIRHIVLPMSIPVISICMIMDFLGTWNSVILPLIVLRDPELLTIPVGLMYLEGEYVKQYGEMMAGYAISSVPLIIMFIFTMKTFVKGLAAGAVKG